MFASRFASFVTGLALGLALISAYLPSLSVTASCAIYYLVACLVALSTVNWTKHAFSAGSQPAHFRERHYAFLSSSHFHEFATHSARRQSCEELNVIGKASPFPRYSEGYPDVVVCASMKNGACRCKHIYSVAFISQVNFTKECTTI